MLTVRCQLQAIIGNSFSSERSKQVSTTMASRTIKHTLIEIPELQL